MLLPPQCGHKQPILPPSVYLLVRPDLTEARDIRTVRRSGERSRSHQSAATVVTNQRPGHSGDPDSANTAKRTPDPWECRVTFCQNILPIKMLRAILKVSLCLSWPLGWRREQLHNVYERVRNKEWAPANTLKVSEVFTPCLNPFPCLIYTTILKSKVYVCVIWKFSRFFQELRPWSTHNRGVLMKLPVPPHGSDLSDLGLIADLL